MEIEKKEFITQGRLYRVTASPSIKLDRYPLIEVFVSESAKRRSHWRRLNYSYKREVLIDHVKRLVEAEKFMSSEIHNITSD